MERNANFGILLEEKVWNTRTKDTLLLGLKGTRKRNMDILLENTRKRLLTESDSVSTAGNIATLNKVVMGLVRRVMPMVIANEIIGVQPMTGPIGQINTWRMRYGDSFEQNGEGINDVSIVAGEEALAPWKIAQGYSGSADGHGALTADLERTTGRGLNFQVVKQIVEAKTRSISARWTIETEQDADAMHDANFESMAMDAMAQQITVDIDQEILRSLRLLAGQDAVYDMAETRDNYQAHFVGDVHAALAIQMNNRANVIASRTRREAGNWAVVSPQTISVLQSAKTSGFVLAVTGDIEAPTNCRLVGKLNGVMRIFSDTYHVDRGSGADVLIGYKGTNESDAAAFYAPYIPLMSAQVVDPRDFTKVTRFTTRYGYVELTSAASSLGNAGDYVSGIAMKNVSFS